jgi:hypothetical protein
MPIIEYECEMGHRKEELFLSHKNIVEEIRCEECEFLYSNEDEGHVYCPMHRIWSKPANIQIGKPSIVFRNPKTGEIQNASYEHQQVPYGFVKEELKSPFERSKFEKEYNQKMAQQDEVQTEIRRQKMADNQKLRQDKNRSNLSKIAAKSDNPSATKSLLKSAIERNRKRERVPKKKTNFHFEVN